jgi:hypothetical protein
MSAEERLGEAIVDVLRCDRPMTAYEIARAMRRRHDVRIDAKTVESMLMRDPRRFRRGQRRFFQRGARWQLVEAGPSTDPGGSGAPVPARPYPPTLSGAAAVALEFAEDEPPTNAIGRTA